MLNESEKKLLEIIEGYEKDIVSLMQKLTQIPSVTGDEAEIGEFVFNEVKKFGLDSVEVVEGVTGRPNVVARYNGSEGKPSITVYAHYDTVPSGSLANWDYGPYSGCVVDGKIYGRGVNDHKFPIPPLLFAIKAITECGFTLKGDVVFAFVCDEERGGHLGTKLLVDRGLLDTDMMLYSVGGGDGKRIGIAANGRQYYRITVRGKTAHTGNNDLAVNAATKAAKLILRLEKLREDVNERRDKFLAGGMEVKGKGRFSINYVHAFVTGNNVPDTCIVQVDRRLIPKVETPESCREEIQQVIDELSAEDPEFDAFLNVVPDRWMESAWSFPDSNLVNSIQNSAEKILGFKPEVSDSVGGGSSDWGWYSHKYPDRPVASYGYSKGSLAHGYNEYATIDGLMDTTKIYTLLLMELLGTV